MALSAVSRAPWIFLVVNPSPLWFILGTGWNLQRDGRLKRACAQARKLGLLEVEDGGGRDLWFPLVERLTGPRREILGRLGSVGYWVGFGEIASLGYAI